MSVRLVLLAAAVVLSGCSLTLATFEYRTDGGGADGAVPPTDAGVDAAVVDAGRDAATVDAGRDAGDADACLPVDEVCDGMDNDCDDAVDEGVALLACRIDADEDGYAAVGSDVVMACVCPEGRSPAPEAPVDCGDGTPEAYPGQSDYFVTRFPKRTGGITVNSYDYDCDGAEELRPLVSGMCRLGLGGSCPAEEGPWTYDPATTGCDHLVQWARCNTDCSSVLLGMQQVGCH